MKPSLRHGLLAAIVGLAACARRVDPNLAPVERIVVLLREMKDRINEDGAKEAMIYGKYSCWCQKTSTRKAKAIEAAQEELRTLGQEILKQRGAVATLTAEIQQLVEDVKTSEEAQKKATSIRKKENAEFMAESGEIKQALAAVDKSMMVLGAATGSAAALVQDQAATTARTARAVGSFLVEVPARATDALSPAKLAMLREAAVVGQHIAGGVKYTPQSGSITGILSEVYATFSKDLEAKTQAEAEANTSYEGFMAVKIKDMKEMQKSMRKKEAEKAEAESLLAEATASFDDTEAQMNADVAFFDEAKASCEAKSEEWAERQSLRSEELKGIDEAIEILSSDEARELFHKSIKPGFQSSFLQVGIASGDNGRNAAYETLRAHAGQARSLRLATLAARVRTGGHFNDVMKAIDDMVQTLKDEADSDAAKREQCKEEFTKIESKVADLNWKIEKNEAKIAKLEDLIEKRKEEKAKTVEDIIDVKEQIMTMEDQRKEENEAYKQAKSDDEESIVLLKQARQTLEAYYKAHDMSITNLVQKEPEFEEDPDKAPDATFSDKGSRRVEGKGVVSVISMVIEDLQGEIATGERDEAAALVAFEKTLAAAQKMQGELEDKKVSLEEAIAKRTEDKTDEEELLKTNTGDRDDEVAYEAEIKPDCDWIIGAFEDRAKKRTAEMEGLVQAKDFLAGYKPPEKAGALLQGGASAAAKGFFDDASLARVSFARVG